MSWFWLVALVLGGWTLVSVAVALAVGHLLAAPSEAHVPMLEDDTGLHHVLLVRATYGR